ncbi:alpha/beta-hydrolase [Pseudovirgaria hyperparasitica]|uniref:Alpha/beta-hydrolase n=1 Tax=Pseudovirgaria hyperparasitica TaxID=470096 RepID=A0A6A6VU51_9PEZI|nr:alpha/beta-hydrolase [Pseudovirgaria hyperparasitica]KAF2753140.1 alpha/beta-hydrolase [Pseudovirgaria hyperparasitica]
MATSTHSQAVNINPDVFDPAAIPPAVTAFNDNLMAITKDIPNWWTVGAAKYRTMRDAGQTAFPPLTKLTSAASLDIPSRDSNRSIPCAVFHPEPTARTPIRGIFMHIHGGGWVLGHERSHDSVLQAIATTNAVVVVSVGYRCAPEHTFPAAPEDCFDAAEWLIEHAEADTRLGGGGARLCFVGGESAGAHLSALVAAHLLGHADARFSGFALRGLVLHFGCFDAGGTPSVGLFRKESPLVLDEEAVMRFRDAFLPGVRDAAGLRDPAVSPLYVDWGRYRGRLPPALFTCGTEDCLLDDTVFMSAKWQMCGGVADVVIIPGAFHGYVMVQAEGSQAEVGLAAVERFMDRYLQ